MISALTGELRRVDPDRVQLQCGAMVFELLVPAADVAELQAILGEQVTFHTIFDLEGDATRGGLTPRLVGFLRPEDKKFFQIFTTVKGIGPKRALRTLAVPIAQIAHAIETKNTRFLIELPEIGKRLAELMVAELSGKLKDFAIGHAAPTGAARGSRNEIEDEAIAICMALGLPRPDAERLLDRVRQSSPGLKTAESISREMLRTRTA